MEGEYEEGSASVNLLARLSESEANGRNVLFLSPNMEVISIFG